MSISVINQSIKVKMGLFRAVQQKFNEHKTTTPTIPKNPNGGGSASEAKTVVEYVSLSPLFVFECRWR